MSDDLGKDVVSLWDKLKGERVSFETHWQECAQYLLPSRADYIGERAVGTKRMQRIYDATGIWACEQFAAGLHSFLTSPTIPWWDRWASPNSTAANPSRRTSSITSVVTGAPQSAPPPVPRSMWPGSTE